MDQNDSGREGSSYQIKLLALIALEGLNHDGNWKEFTEYNDAGDFNDIVYLSENKNSSFAIQCKHKRDKKKTKISKNDLVKKGLAIRCYECMSRLGPGESSACLTGDRNIIRRVHCMGPSVCAAYQYQSVIPGTPTTIHITRGCQSMRYGATCEDIFNELRSNGQVLPGQHTCTTCSSDLCNSAGSTKNFFVFMLAMTSMAFVINGALS